MFRSVFLILTVFFSRMGWAYPEYSVRYGTMRCTGCHLSPVGGGPRTVDGKLYGAHGFKLNPFLAQDYVGADLRVLYDYPQHPTTSKGGAGVMMGSVSGHLALDEAQRVHVVIEQNIAGFTQAAARDTYALFRFANEDGQPHFFDSLLIGRFREPFGIVTDEHRTYTRVQTASEFFSYDTGLLLSGTPTNQLHYDLAMVSGDHNAGTSLGTGVSERWGAVANLRWMPGAALFGASASHYDHEPAAASREALSLYSILSLARWTSNRVPAALRVERVSARGYGDHLGEGFASDAAYVTSLSRARSTGWLAWFDYYLGERLTLIYKFESLTPDRDFPADVYLRHGVGLRWVVAPETIVQLRTEFARATPPSEQAKTGSAAQDATYGILQLAF